MVANIFDEIASDLKIDDITGEIVRSKFKNLKDTYRRLKNDSKPKSGNATEKTPLEKWEYSSQLAFLAPYIEDASTDSNFNIRTENEDSQDDVENSANSLTDDARSTSQKEESTTMGNKNEGSKRPSAMPKKERARKVSKVDKLVNAIMESGQEGDETLRKISQKNNNEDDLFYDSCKARMNKIADEKKEWVRFKISEILYQAESTAPISQAPYSPQGTMYSNFQSQHYYNPYPSYNYGYFYSSGSQHGYNFTGNQ